MTDNALIPVCVGACLCPGTPHADGDFVYLRPTLAWRHVTAIKWEIVFQRTQVGADLPASEIMGILSEGYLLYGIAEWTLRDDKGPIAVTRSFIESEILANGSRASVAGEKADDLYSEQVVLPLVTAGEKSLAATSSNGSTSARNGSPAKSRKPSKRSSITTTQTGVTETTT